MKRQTAKDAKGAKGRVSFASIASFALILSLPGGGARAQDAPPPRGPSGQASLEGLFLDFSKTQLGPISTQDAKKKYLYTIQLEKSRLMHKLLRTIYENAYELYRQGDFDGSKELTGRILSMDPGFQDAVILHRAAIELKGTAKPMISERKLVEDRFEEGMALYRQGRLVEASERWEESVKLSPANLKARYWLRKVRGELSEEHYRRGSSAYKQHRLRDALDQWYAALVLNPKFPRLMGVISKAEAELRRQEANDKLQRALTLYGQGKTDEALKLLDEVLQIDPAEAKAQKLIAEIRLEIATQHVVRGREHYKQRKYTTAIKEWNKAVEYGYDPRRANMLVAKAKEQMRKEEEAKRLAAEREAQEAERKRQEEEERKRKEAEEKAKAEEEAKKALDATPVEAAPQAQVSTEEQKRQAVKHWNNGLIYYQKNDYAKARDEWLLCKQYDPSNSECMAGLQRIDAAYSGGP